MEIEKAQARLEYIRQQLRAECVSYDELHELQSLTPFIEKGDSELLEAAGVPEFQTADWEFIGKSSKYYYWYASVHTGGKGKGIYQCTADSSPPNTDSGYWDLNSLRKLKGDNTETLRDCI